MPHRTAGHILAGVPPAGMGRTGGLSAEVGGRMGGMGRASERRTVLRIEVGDDSDAGGIGGSTRQVRRMDTVAGEEPLEIRVGAAGQRH